MGHRFVSGGLEYSEPAIVDSEMILALKEMSLLAPEHLPGALAAVRGGQCIDTSMGITPASAW